MPKYKVLGGTWGEGWEIGQIVEMDSFAATARLALGEIEEVGSKVIVEAPAPIVTMDAPEEAPVESAAAEEVVEVPALEEVEVVLEEAVEESELAESEVVEGEESPAPKRRGRPPAVKPE